MEFHPSQDRAVFRIGGTGKGVAARDAPPQAAPAQVGLAPDARVWRMSTQTKKYRLEPRGKVLRLINLERRARFGCLD